MNIRWLAAFALLASCGGAQSGSTTPPTGADAALDVADAAVSDATAPSDATQDVASADAPAETGPACGCSSYGDPASVGALPKVLNETSGLAVSRKNPGVLWAHNDSGDSPRIFALDEKGALLGQIDLGGATAVDWEDLAVGPCPSGHCIFVGDVGDNSKARTDVALYRVDEPVVDGKPFATRTLPAQRFPFSYPDGPWNCETVLVHPTTGDVFLVTKIGTSAAGLYRFPSPLTPNVPVVVERLGSVAKTGTTLVTGGDISPCGDRVLLRTYFSLLEYAVPAGKGIAEALALAPTSLPVAGEPQGEAVAYRPDGRGYLTASEGVGVPLNAVGCR